ncbi:MAG: PAS domain S-box protein, partial [Acidobacteria bacterium]|nr:PAS domain S-box protein [Acidobacteriota bacterium]
RWMLAAGVVAGGFAAAARTGLAGAVNVAIGALAIIPIAVLRECRSSASLQRAGKQAAASEEHYRELFENAEDFIVTLDAQGRFTSANKAVLRVSGYKPEEFIGRSLIDLLAPASVEYGWSAFKNVLTGRKRTEHTQLEMVRKDGRSLWIEANSTRIMEQGKTVGIQTIGRDVSGRKRMEAELLEAQKMEALGRLAGGVAHDFNNLLGVIIGYGDLVLHQLPAEAPERRRMEEIIKASHRAAEVTRQLLAFSRRQILQTKHVDLNGAIRDTAGLLLRLLREDIELVTRLSPSAVHVIADPAQLQQAIINLAINARDAMPQGGRLVLESTTVVLGREECATASRQTWGNAVAPGRYAVLSVSDTGAGMDEQTKSRVFEPFFTTKGAAEGKGLGLATVQGFVKQSGGYVAVHSEPGRGARFEVYLPEAEPRLAFAEKEQTTEALPRGSETVLVVEDEQSLRELNCELLRSLGYMVLEASYGAQAVELAAQHQGRIDLLLTDVVMPGMSGRELAGRLALTRPETKILYMSGYADSVIAGHGLRGGSLAFVQKPFTRSALAQKLRTVLEAQPSFA